MDPTNSQRLRAVCHMMVSLDGRGARREDYVASGEHRSFAIAADPSGKLLWESGQTGGDHVVALLTERVSDEYLACCGNAASRTSSRAAMSLTSS